MIWKTLGIARTRDRDAIRRAYAKKLRATNPEDDPQGFMALREAYEIALSRAAAGNTAEPEELLSPSPLAGEVALGEAEPGEWPPSPEPDPDQTALIGHQQALVSALQSPWATPPETLIAHFESILASPALESIAVAEDVEHWLAHVIASHIPASDSLVQPAAAHFGWDNNTGFHTPSPAIAAVAHRQQVLDFVGVTSLRYRPLNLGWQALTKSPSHPVLMRLKAMMPGLPAEVETLLETAAHSLQGIEDWFDTEALAWWQQHLSRERVRAGHLALIPLAAIIIGLTGLLAVWPMWLTTGLLLTSLAAPWLGVRLIKQPQRDRAQRPWDYPQWQLSGWMVAMLALPPLAMILPGTTLGLALIALAALAVLAWTTIAVPVPRELTGTQRVIAIVRRCWVFGIMTVLGTPLMTTPRALAWTIVTLALVLCWWRADEKLVMTAQTLTARIMPARFATLLWTVIALLVAIAGAMTAIGTTPPEGLYRIYITSTAAMLILYGANRMAFTMRIKWFLIIGWLAVLFTAFLGIGRAAPESPGPELASSERSIGDVPSTTAPSVQSNGDLPRITVPGLRASGAAAPAIAPGDNPPAALRPVDSWVNVDDYPGSLLADEGMLTIELRLDISPQGRVTACNVTRSSGKKAIDDITCAAATARARFAPATDSSGKPVKSRYDAEIVWTIPPGVQPRIAPPQAAGTPAKARTDINDWVLASDYPDTVMQDAGKYSIGFRVDIDTAGRVGDCRITASSGDKTIDKVTCDAITRRARFDPARNAQGKPVPGAYGGTLRWTITRTAPPPTPLPAKPLAADRVAPDATLSPPTVDDRSRIPN